MKSLSSRYRKDRSLDSKSVEELVNDGWPEHLARAALAAPGVRFDVIGEPGMTDEQRRALGIDGSVDDLLRLIRQARARQAMPDH